jgi:hypothetical protein
MSSTIWVPSSEPGSVDSPPPQADDTRNIDKIKNLKDGISNSSVYTRKKFSAVRAA